MTRPEPLIPEHKTREHPSHYPAMLRAKIPVSFQLNSCPNLETGTETAFAFAEDVSAKKVVGQRVMIGFGLCPSWFVWECFPCLAERVRPSFEYSRAE